MDIYRILEVLDSIQIETPEVQENQDGRMALTQLKTIMTDCTEILNGIKHVIELPTWILAKITLATDSISTVTNYLQSEQNLNEGEENTESDMIYNQLITIGRNGGILSQLIAEEDSLPAWIGVKITKAAQNISDVRAFIVGQTPLHQEELTIDNASGTLDEELGDSCESCGYLPCQCAENSTCPSCNCNPCICDEKPRKPVEEGILGGLMGQFKQTASNALDKGLVNKLLYQHGYNKADEKIQGPYRAQLMQGAGSYLVRLYKDGQIMDKLPANNIDELKSALQKVDAAMKSGPISEKLSKNATAGDYIKDFENSKNAKFKGKSKVERKKMALGAYYSAHPEKSKKNESVDELSALVKLSGLKESSEHQQFNRLLQKYGFTLRLPARENFVCYKNNEKNLYLHDSQLGFVLKKDGKTLAAGSTIPDLELALRKYVGQQTTEGILGGPFDKVDLDKNNDTSKWGGKYDEFEPLYPEKPEPTDSRYVGKATKCTSKMAAAAIKADREAKGEKVQIVPRFNGTEWTYWVEPTNGSVDESLEFDNENEQNTFSDELHNEGEGHFCNKCGNETCSCGGNCSECGQHSDDLDLLNVCPACRDRVDYEENSYDDEVDESMNTIEESLSPERANTGLNRAPRGWSNSPNEQMASWKALVQDADGPNNPKDMFNPVKGSDNIMTVAANKKEEKLHESSSLVRKLTEKLADFKKIGSNEQTDSYTNALPSKKATAAIDKANSKNK